MDVRSGSSLTISSFEDACSPPVGAGATVDLSSARFLDAYAIVAVACNIVGACGDGRAVNLRWPVDEDAAAYLVRMHLAKLVEDCGARVHGAVPVVREHDRSGRLLELTTYDDVRGGEQLAELVFERLEGAVDNTVVTALYEAIVELGANTVEHAGSDRGGLVCGQTYRRGTPDEYVVFAAGDTGVGLRSSLSSQFSGIDDRQAIELALQRDVSGTGVPGRGQGLAEIRDVARRLGGRMIVRSGTARALSTGGRTRIHDVAPLRGTVVGVTLPCRPG